jgi:acetylornithine deacetylase/succinyl-diaminopimelate desuccinylase-like protein
MAGVAAIVLMQMPGAASPGLREAEAEERGAESSLRAEKRHQGAALQSAPAKVDFEALSKEATEWLAGLIKIDTTNPPGNELAAAKYLGEILRREGIDAEVIESAPGRGVLIARMRAGLLPDPGRALMLLSHTDVVGVDRAKWSVDPFGGIIKDGYLYGRGTLDAKGLAVAELAVLVALKRAGVKLDRDVVFVAEGDEEEGGEAGIEFVLRRHWEKAAAAFAINEGGRVVEKDGHVHLVEVQASEKVPVNLELIATGPAGHGSVPRQDNAVLKLAAAVAKIGAYETPVKMNTVTRRYFERLATIEPDAELAKWMRALEQPERMQTAARRLSAASAVWSSMLRNSIAPTVLRAGFRSNVVPSEARATLNVRMFPGESVTELIANLTKLVNDPQVEIVGGQASRPLAPASSLDTELYGVIEKVTPAVFPGSTTLPTLSTWATDSAQLRMRNVQAYGINPFPLPESEIERIHSDDERISLTAFRRGIEYLYAVVEGFVVKR